MIPLQRRYDGLDLWGVGARGVLDDRINSSDPIQPFNEKHALNYSFGRIVLRYVYDAEVIQTINRRTFSMGNVICRIEILTHRGVHRYIFNRVRGYLEKHYQTK